MGTPQTIPPDWHRVRADWPECAQDGLAKESQLQPDQSFLVHLNKDANNGKMVFASSLEKKTQQELVRTDKRKRSVQ